MTRIKDLFSFPFLSDNKFDINSNCVNEEQSEADKVDLQEDSNIKHSTEGSEESLQKPSMLENIANPPVGPQAAEE